MEKWTSEQVLNYVDPIQKENEELKKQVAAYQDKEKQTENEPKHDTQSITDMAREANIRNK